MELIVFCLVLAVVWIGMSFWKLSERSAGLESRLRHLEGKLQRLQKTWDDATPRSDRPASNVQPKAEPVPSKDQAPPIATPKPHREPPVAPLPPPLLDPWVPQTDRPSLQAPPPLIPSVPSTTPAPTPSSFNWEQFVGVKLFAWLGGLVLFLAVSFFIKYSIERDLIPPSVRVGLGFLTGIGLLAGGQMLWRRRYHVTAQTLCGTGVVILYAATFASRMVYEFGFFGPVRSFVLMVLITAVAFFQAVRLNAPVVAILGLAGGFLTPVLLSTGQDHPTALFSYVALLDVGLLAVAFHRRWDYLAFLAALGTAAIELGWIAKFFAEAKVITALIVFLGLDLLFLLGTIWFARKDRLEHWMQIALAGLAFLTMIFSWYLLFGHDFGARPVLPFAFVLGGDLCLLALVLLRPRLFALHLAGGSLAFLTLALWIGGHLTSSLLGFALIGCLGFALLHSVFPVLLQRWRPNIAPLWWAHLFPMITLVILFLPLLKLATLPLLLWPAVLLLNLIVIGLAWLTASLFFFIAAVFLTASLVALWIMSEPATLDILPDTLFLIGGFAVLFLGASLFLHRRIQGLDRDKTMKHLMPAGLPSSLVLPSEWQRQTPALATVLPFLLLFLVTLRLPMTSPSPVFALGLLLTGLSLGLTRLARMPVLPLVALGSIVLVEMAWHIHQLSIAQPVTSLLWYLVFYFTVALFPFVSLRNQTNPVTPWIAAALSGPLHFLLLYELIRQAWPNDVMGLIPAAFVLPTAAGLEWIRRNVPAERKERTALLAWFGGVTLLFVSLIFPIQWERQWLTISWALEGAALLWLFHRVPHPGLKTTGVALLFIAFIRLALNPAVLSYHPRGVLPILNWYLYSYGLVTVCLFAGARLLAAPRNLVLGRNTPPLLYALGTVLAFLLMNIEIADFFAKPNTRTLTFEFYGNLGRDMTYSIAWALFAFLLLVLGIRSKLRPVRYGSLALLGVTLLKVFFHDLANLARLYRVGALIGVAIVAIVASFLYQKFLSDDTR